MLYLSERRYFPDMATVTSSAYVLVLNVMFRKQCVLARLKRIGDSSRKQSSFSHPLNYSLLNVANDNSTQEIVHKNNNLLIYIQSLQSHEDGLWFNIVESSFHAEKSYNSYSCNKLYDKVQRHLIRIAFSDPSHFELAYSV